VNGTPTAITTSISGAAQVENSDLVHTAAVSATQTIGLKVDAANTPGAAVVYWGFQFDSTTAAESMLFGNALVNLSTTDTQYASLTGAAYASTTETDCQFTVPCAGTFKNLYVYLSIAPGAAASGKTRTFTLRSNAGSVGAPGNVSVTISETATSGNDLTNSYHAAAGEKITIMSTLANAPAASASRIGLTFVADVDGDFIIPMSSGRNLDTANVKYSPVTTGDPGVSWATVANAYQVAANAFTAKSIYAVLSGAPGAGKSYTFALYDDGVSTAESVAISGASDVSGNHVENVSVAAGSLLAVQCTPAGTPTVRIGNASICGFMGITGIIIDGQSCSAIDGQAVSARY
jgi:hypothetical protein